MRVPFTAFVTTIASLLTAPLLLVGLAATPANAAVMVTASASDTYERQAVNVTNKHRINRNLRALSTDTCLARFANRHAHRMATQHRLFHQDLSPILRACNLTLVGENVGVGYTTGRAVVSQGYMNSPPHRQNLLTPQFRLTAVGAAQANNGTWYTSQVLGYH